jgi:hypothetical protein
MPLKKAFLNNYFNPKQTPNLPSYRTARTPRALRRPTVETELRLQDDRHAPEFRAVPVDIPIFLHARVVTRLNTYWFAVRSQFGNGVSNKNKKEGEVALQVDQT